MGRESQYTSPTNSPQQGNATSSWSRTWRPCWPWAASAHGRSFTRNCTLQSKWPPQQPLLNTWVCPLGSRNPEEDNQEVTFPGGGRWGQSRQPTPSLEPVQSAGGGVSSGPPPQVPHPTPSGSDVGQLITTLALGLHLGTPKINTFSSGITPGKTEVLFEQWNHKVQCIKDHYPESVVQESIMRSLKGAAADMAWYMGPTAGVSDIFDKPTVIFGTVALFDVLMQTFYKITQGNNEKVLSFTMRLEGTLNQIRLRCLKWITDHEVPWHLKEQLFHRVQRYVRDWIRYLYGNSETTYSELVIAAHWAESKMEETKERVKVRSAASTEVATGSRELGDQIARLMAALTRVEQGSCLLVLLIVPGTGVMGEGEQIGILLPTTALTLVRLAWVKLLLFTAPQLQVERALILKEGGIHRCKMVHRVVLRAQGTPTCCNASDARVGVTWQWNVPLQPKC